DQHRRGHTSHVHPGGRGRPNGGQYGPQVADLQVQRSPMRNERGAQTKTVAEPLGGRQGLVCGLAIDMQHSSAAEDEIGPCVPMHPRSPQHAAHHSGDRLMHNCAAGEKGFKPAAFQNAQASHGPHPQAPVATDGCTILPGSTMRSKSASVTKPKARAAALSVRSFSMAWWAICDALS